MNSELRGNVRSEVAGRAGIPARRRTCVVRKGKKGVEAIIKTVWRIYGLLRK